ncbi:DHHW family protein [Sedimentibacter saalensis]|uniref:DHHW family protein n=1 Tax=Sedimentibacter saalensis TaxID=130788 RepID=UPI002897BDF8|nr:DHHW family protein [Sedimentibacter saalensis]
MKNNIKNIVVIVSFIIIIWGFMFANILIPDNEFSFSERRRLITFPNYSLQKLLSGEFVDEFEKYSLDQFIFRDAFRGLKAIGKYYLFNQKDNNNMYIINGIIEKMEYKLDEKSVVNAAEKLNEVYEKYFNGKNVYYAIIPDKSYFIAAENGYLTINYDRMLELMDQNTRNMQYIDLFTVISIEDYYKTDIHWRQEKIIKIADLLLNEMGNDAKLSGSYIEHKLYPFYGSYYGHAALKLQPDSMFYLTNEIIENAVVFDHQSNTFGKVYNLEMFDGMDPYDVFLSGAKPLITVYNEDCKNDKELLLFRDSFGSSIAPLMLEGYSKITLIDLRYISTDLLGNYIDFSQDQDVLFLYNTRILNNSSMLK